MAKTFSVDEFELLEFFEAVPVHSDDGVPWIYNNSVYEVVRDGAQASFAIAPSYRDVRITLRIHGNVLYELSAMGIEDVKLHSKEDREWLEVVVSRRQSIRLIVNPEISIHENLNESDGGG